MSDMVAVIGDDGSQAGQMYLRRACQLVKKQRAVWVDKYQQSIRLSPGVTLEPEEAEDGVRASEAGEIRGSAPVSRGRLYEAALRRICQRRNMMWHTAALLPGYAVLWLLAYNLLRYDAEGALLAGFLLGVWTALYAVHLVSFARPRVKAFRLLSEEERILREIKRMER